MTEKQCGLFTTAIALYKFRFVVLTCFHGRTTNLKRIKNIIGSVLLLALAAVCTFRVEQMLLL
ncbi:hypothetical protein RchiOBHm_Chr6g0246531 [Rosa chinensis]|uniref:Uncharacterized protein n=1 Tax=Rosa chinensis TaxID=74649 RepID=A0A2P6PJJ9_ROSCH|nr:hypothetical protein RchiOBHm_Chr6g0246531 [Rosa chinensis]